MKTHYSLVLLAFVWSTAVYSGLYRWVDEHGKVHYGDRIPPAYAQNGHVKLHKSGLMKEKVESAAARKERIEKAARDIEIQKKLKEEQHEADLQEMRDTQLRSMFSSLEELEMVYQSKLEMADGGIAILQARHKKLSESLEKLEARHERMLNPNDKNLLGMKIDDILDNLHIYQQAITDNQIERTKIEERFKKDLLRYTQLTGEEKKSASDN